jgi:hypothetical protein
MSQIMKKAILTVGLFSMMMVLTSFTTVVNNISEKTDSVVSIPPQGGVKVPNDGKKLDYDGDPSIPLQGGIKIPSDGGKKLDYDGDPSIPLQGGIKIPSDGGKKLD